MAGHQYIVYGVIMQAPQSFQKELDNTTMVCFASLRAAREYIDKVQESEKRNNHLAYVPRPEYPSIGMTSVGCIAELRVDRGIYVTCKDVPIQYTSDSVTISKLRFSGGYNSYPRDEKAYDMRYSMETRMQEIEHTANVKHDVDNGNLRTVYAIAQASPTLHLDMLQRVPYNGAPLFSSHEQALACALEMQEARRGEGGVYQTNKPHKLDQPKYTVRGGWNYMIQPIQITETDFQAQYGSSHESAAEYTSDLEHGQNREPQKCTIVIGADSYHDAQVLVPQSESIKAWNQYVQQQMTARRESLVQQANEVYLEKIQHGSRAAIDEAALNYVMDANMGSRLIDRWAKFLEGLPKYSDFATQLRAAYDHNIFQYRDYNTDTRASAYRAMESVFSKVQRSAAQNGDFETATIANNIVRGSQGALDDLRQEAQQTYRMTREQLEDEFNVHIPEEEDVCV